MQIQIPIKKLQTSFASEHLTSHLRVTEPLKSQREGCVSHQTQSLNLFWTHGIGQCEDVCEESLLFWKLKKTFMKEKLIECKDIGTLVHRSKCPYSSPAWQWPPSICFLEGFWLLRTMTMQGLRTRKRMDKRNKNRDLCCPRNSVSAANSTKIHHRLESSELIWRYHSACN